MSTKPKFDEFSAPPTEGNPLPRRFLHRSALTDSAHFHLEMQPPGKEDGWRESHFPGIAKKNGVSFFPEKGYFLFLSGPRSNMLLKLKGSSNLLTNIIGRESKETFLMQKITLSFRKPIAYNSLTQ